MSNSGSVSFVVVGLGPMGRASLNAITELILGGEFEGKVRIGALVDPGLAHIDAETKQIVDTEASGSGHVRETVVRPLTEFANDFLEQKKQLKASTFTSLKEALLNIERVEGEILVVYDASPTVLHQHQLDLCLAEDHTAYIGEKPIFTQPGNLEAMRTRVDEPWWCEFVETESQVVLTLRAELERRNESITSMSFWRYSSMGIKKILQPLDRNGVQGGTILDKVVHDLSIANALVPGSGEIVVEQAAAREFMPSHILSLFEGTEFLGAADSPVLRLVSGQHSDHTQEGAADSVFELKASIMADGGKPVPCEFHASWVGFPNRDSDPILDSLENYAAVTSSPWYRNVVQQPTWGRPSTDRVRFEDQELRLGKIQTSQATYVMNLLNKEVGGNGNDDTTVEPKVLRREKGSEAWEEIPLEDVKFGANSLARVFSAVARQLLSGVQADKIDGRATIRVHEAMLRAQASAIDGFAVAFGEPALVQKFEGREEHYMEVARTTFRDRLEFVD